MRLLTAGSLVRVQLEEPFKKFAATDKVAANFLPYFLGKTEFGNGPLAQLVRASGS